MVGGTYVPEVELMIWRATDKQLAELLEAAVGHEDADVAARVVKRVEAEREKRDG